MTAENQTPPEDDKVEATAAAEEAQAGAGAEQDVPPTVDAVQAEIESLNAQLHEAKEQVLRAQADVQNIRRRAEQDVEKAHKFGQEKLVNDLLPVVDNLERALEAMDVDSEALKPVLEGVQLTLKSFHDTLARHKVEAVDPVGEPFDPQKHQAMTMVASPDVEPNTVINVFQKGYTLHGRLVRPAMVVVAKAPE
ncbi:MAG: nucleotide exchange factor GrpE [Gammaproteobacteria bacterium]|uniref:nucleotide exchange factor GrpE n=1 Tax=Pseudomaricurvus alcaniphilus TaxID=1166482 RepID=UPI00140C57F0|nr:nucleotide exchange factor GrpE [Gammaproteobacteria bacterium]NHN36883.1 nucleotide exchange factor GrpE [Pseudomaricurvus alcaniphilus]